MKLNRRAIVLCAALLPMTGMACGNAFGQDAGDGYPERAVNLVVPFAPGGFPDVVARIVAGELQQRYGHPFIVQNLPGAGGIAAVETVTRSDPDGYTLLVADNQSWGITPNIYNEVPFDPESDLTPIALLATTPVYVAVRSDMDVASLQDLIDLVNENPNRYSYATPGIASPHHFLMEMLKSATGMDVAHIPYRGGSQVAPALVGGEVDIAITSYTNIAPFLEEDAVRLLAVSTTTRADKMPDVPTLAEAGVEDVQFTVALGVLAPSATPAEIVAELSDAFREAIASDQAAEQLDQGGFSADGGDGEAFAALIASDLAYFAEAVEIAEIERQ